MNNEAKNFNEVVEAPAEVTKPTLPRKAGKMTQKLEEDLLKAAGLEK